MSKPNLLRSRWLIALAGGALLAATWQGGQLEQWRDLLFPGDQANAAPAESDRATQPYRSATVESVPPAFSLEQDWGIPVFASLLAAGDFNGDGREDLAANVRAEAYGLPTGIHFYLQQPDGSFAAPLLVPFPFLIGTFGMTAADLNEDGRDDLLMAANGENAGLHYLLSQPDGEFAWRVDDWSNEVARTPTRAADVDGDGHVDVVVQLTYQNFTIPSDFGGQVATYFGDGTGTFTRHGSVSTRDISNAADLGDLDGDARPDFLTVPVTALDHRPMVRRNNGAGGWLDPQALGDVHAPRFRGGVIADLTGEGRADAVLLSNTQPARFDIYPQLADGSLAPQATSFGAGGYSQFLHHADLNGDGRTDLVHLDEGSSVPRFYYYLSDEYGPGYPITKTLVIDDPQKQFVVNDIVTADFNDDGITDVAVATRFHGLIVTHGKLTPHAGPGGLPGAPTIVLVDVQGPADAPTRTVDVTVAAPADDGGSPILGYNVYSVPGGIVDSFAGSTVPVHRFLDLPNNASYVFYARAINAAGLGPASAFTNPVVLGTPVDPNAPPVLSFNLQPIDEFDVGNRTVQIQGQLNKPASAGGVRFDVATSDGSAIAGVDYVANTQGDIFIPEGSWIAPPIDVTVIGDMQYETDETLQLVFSDLQGLTVAGAPNTLTILNDDDTGPQLGIGSASVVEGNAGSQVVNLLIKLSQARQVDVVFDVTTSSGNASTKAGVDFEPFNLEGAKIPAGQTELLIPVTIRGDTDYEVGENVRVSVSNLQGAWQGVSQGTIWIGNDDAIPTLSVADISIDEGDQGSVVAHFTAILSTTLGNDVSFSAYTVDGSAKGGSDFASRYLGTLVIRAGDRSVDMEVKLFPDRRFEPNETFSLQLESETGAAIADGTAVATIVNDDQLNSISVDDVTVSEGGIAQFTLRLSEPSAQAVTVDVATSQGTAVADVDYQTSHAEGLVIPAGSTSITFDVPTIEDTMVEATETFVLNLSNVSGAAMGDAQGLGRIGNDDVATISISDSSVVEGAYDTVATMVFEVKLSEPLTVPVTFWVELAGGQTATLYEDVFPTWFPQLIRIDPGRTRATYRAYVYGDPFAEANETFTAKLVNVTGANVGDDTAVGTIINDDGAGVRGGRSLAKTQSRISPKQPSH